MNAPLADLVQANIDGQAEAYSAIDRLHRHYSDPDALFRALQALIPERPDLVGRARLRGFMRAIQKRLEQTA